MTLAIDARGLRKRFGRTEVLSGLDLAVPSRHRVRPARAERRGQDDDHQHPHDARAGRLGHGAGRRPRRRRRRRGGEAPHQPHRPVRGGRRRAHRHGEPRHDGPALRARAPRGRARAPPSCSNDSTSRMPRAAGSAPTRAACAVDSTSRSASSSRRPVLFLDEPTTGLDTRSRQELWSVIRSLAGAGTTVFLTTQYLEEADRLADRIAVLDGGRIAAEGTPGGAEGPHRRRRRRAARRRRRRSCSSCPPTAACTACAPRSTSSTAPRPPPPTASPCRSAGPASTTCSSPSPPATRHPASPELQEAK